jgi:hypothetical protein
MPKNVEKYIEMQQLKLFNSNGICALIAQERQNAYPTPPFRCETVKMGPVGRCR